MLGRTRDVQRCAMKETVTRGEDVVLWPYWNVQPDQGEDAYQWLRTLVEGSEQVRVLEIPYRRGSTEGMLMAVSTEMSCTLARKNHECVGCISDYPAFHVSHWRSMRVFWHPGRAFLNFSDLAAGLLTDEHVIGESFGDFLDDLAATMGPCIGSSWDLVADGRVMESLDAYLRRLELGHYAELVFEYAWQEMHCLQCRIRHFSPASCPKSSCAVYLLNAAVEVSRRQKPDVHRWYLYSDWLAAGQDVAWPEWVMYQQCGVPRLLCLPEEARYECFEMESQQLKRLWGLMKQVRCLDAGVQYVSRLKRTWRFCRHVV